MGRGYIADYPFDESDEGASIERDGTVSRRAAPRPVQVQFAEEQLTKQITIPALGSSSLDVRWPMIDFRRQQNLVEKTHLLAAHFSWDPIENGALDYAGVTGFNVLAEITYGAGNTTHKVWHDITRASVVALPATTLAISVIVSCPVNSSPPINVRCMVAPIQGNAPKGRVGFAADANLRYPTYDGGLSSLTDVPALGLSTFAVDTTGSNLVPIPPFGNDVQVLCSAASMYGNIVLRQWSSYNTTSATLCASCVVNTPDQRVPIHPMAKSVAAILNVVVLGAFFTPVFRLDV